MGGGRSSPAPVPPTIAAITPRTGSRGRTIAIGGPWLGEDENGSESDVRAVGVHGDATQTRHAPPNHGSGRACRGIDPTAVIKCSAMLGIDMCGLVVS